MFVEKLACMCPQSEVRPVRLKLPILRFRGEEVTISATSFTPLITSAAIVTSSISGFQDRVQYSLRYTATVKISSS